jgi:hypothetical protein
MIAISFVMFTGAMKVFHPLCVSHSIFAVKEKGVIRLVSITVILSHKLDTFCPVKLKSLEPSLDYLLFFRKKD